MEIIFLGRDREEGRAVGNTVTNLGGSIKCEEFLD
jgi:hypothetical protein